MKNDKSSFPNRTPDATVLCSCLIRVALGPKPDQTPRPKNIRIEK